MRHKSLRWCLTHQAPMGVADNIRDKRRFNGCKIIRLDATSMRKVDFLRLKIYFENTPSGKENKFEFFWTEKSQKTLRGRQR